MKYHLVSGGCGFVGRNMVKRLYRTTNDKIIFVDNLSVGTHPSEWLGEEMVHHDGPLQLFGADRRALFLHQDFREFLRDIIDRPGFISETYAPDFERFSDVFHFAAIVGGRSTIEGDPMKVALDLSIDAEFFYWITRHRPDRTLYPSSSAAYPIDLQTEGDAIALAESDIDFKRMGEPDMTYGWSKLTGEFLAKTAAEHYDLSVTCIRPFSGYGEDQDQSYPIPAIAARIARREDPVEVWGTGRQGRDFVHIDDVLDCIFFAMERVTDGSAINIGRGELLSFIDIIHTLCDIEGYQPEIKQLLDKPVGVFSRYSKMDKVHAMGWRASISVREGMRRVLDSQRKLQKARE